MCGEKDTTAFSMLGTFTTCRALNQLFYIFDSRPASPNNTPPRPAA